ncbi:MAG: glycosyltransferase family 39 protein, partial [Anaerolineae bacterium]
MLSWKHHRHLIAVYVLVVLAFFVRAATLDVQSMWRDEVDALRFATLPWSEMQANFTRPGWNGPVFYLLLRGWIALAGTSEFALRFFSLCFGVLSVPLMVVLGRQLFRLSVGLISALLVATSPYLVWYSQEVKMYALVPTLGLLAIYSLGRALKGGGWPWWLVQIGATSLAFYSHILAALLIPVQVLISFAWWPQLRKRWRQALVSLACLTLPYLPLVVWQAPLALEARDTGFHAYTLNQMVVILLYAWSTGITEWGRPWGPALMGLLALGGFGAAVSALPLFSGPRTERVPESGTARHVMLAFWLLVPLLCIWIISLRQPLFTDRYLIWSAPAFYLLVAYTLALFASGEDSGRFAGLLLLGVILTLNGFNLWRQAATPIKADFRAAAAYVASYDSTGSPSDHFQAGGQSR